jgi:G protein-coupled receptor GPR1
MLAVLYDHERHSYADTDTAALHSLAWRGTTTTPASGGKIAGGSLNDAQTRAILISALSCACISLVLVSIALRWFLFMRRSFRHRLVLFLIAGDTMKAVWYFVFPIVVFARGPVASDSSFCQASGFFLAFAIESSDMAILIIALHSILYILRPNNTVGEGGLYPIRRWIYLIWLGPPLAAASLAFANGGNGYVTAGTFCYLPKRPIWYRLALSWVPRYLIVCLVLVMYVWIYAYVHIKFRGFDYLGDGDSSYDSDIRRRSAFSARSAHAEEKAAERSSVVSALPVHPPTSPPTHRQANSDAAKPAPQAQPWDHMHFITARPLQNVHVDVTGTEESRNVEARGSEWSCDTQVSPSDGSPSSSSKVKTDNIPLHSMHRSRHSDSHAFAENSPEKVSVTSAGRKDPLKATRLAIRKQLRYLFIYPLVYMIMWSFPFASHALNYSSYYVMHPIFWLSVVQTVMLSLQAGVDSIMFSISEKPWRKAEAGSKLSVPFLRRRSDALLQRRSPDNSATSTTSPNSEQPASPTKAPMWWEAEGRRRKDSVWLGTGGTGELSSPITTTRSRSKSPQKRKLSFHTRTRSTEQENFVPKLEPIAPETNEPADMGPLSSPESSESRVGVHRADMLRATSIPERDVNTSEENFRDRR